MIVSSLSFLFDLLVDPKRFFQIQQDGEKNIPLEIKDR
jgi:hypothetical protein